MENPTPTEIGQKIVDVTGVDIYANTRKRDNVEHRSLLCYLLRTKLNMRWTYISLFLNSKGKNFDHASVIHAVKMYPIYKNYNNDLDELEHIFKFQPRLKYNETDSVNYIENKFDSLSEKYKELEDKYDMLVKSL